MTVIKKN
jgi:hypothetical protein